jgi:hypothetical protein
MREHQLLPKWSFQFDSAKLAFGKCNFTDRVISLSRHLVELNNEAEVRDTVLHEIAHALAPAVPATAPNGARSPARSAAAPKDVTAAKSSAPSRSSKAPAHPAAP